MYKFYERYIARISKKFNKLNNQNINRKYHEIYSCFKEYTMIPYPVYIQNLSLVARYNELQGSVVECGTWRGGMIGGIAKLLGPQRKYFLYDSFEGLPDAREIDGQSAINWQNDTQSDSYYNNCSAEIEYAREAMKISGAADVIITKGWFSETLPLFPEKETIAILRLDGDWYDSTMSCLTNLYDYIIQNGLVIIDDYYAWDGCAKAIHDFFSHRSLACRIQQWNNSKFAYFLKR